MCPAKISLAEIGSAEIRPSEAGPDEICFAEVYNSEVGPCEICHDAIIPAELDDSLNLRCRQFDFHYLALPILSLSYPFDE